MKFYLIEVYAPKFPEILIGGPITSVADMRLYVFPHLTMILTCLLGVNNINDNSKIGFEVLLRQRGCEHCSGPVHSHSYSSLS